MSTRNDVLSTGSVIMLRHLRVQAAVALAAALLPTPAECRTVIVPENSSGERDLVASALKSAADGDTLSIGPGTYFENLKISQSALTVIGAGAGVTILRGDNGDGSSHGAVVCAEDPSPRSLTMSGVTLTNGDGCAGRDLALSGGALCWWSEGCGGTLAMDHCAVENSAAGGGFYGLGGGVYADGLSEIRFDACEFRNNSAGQNGGNIYVLGCVGNTSNVSITNCTVDIGTAPGREAGGVFVERVGSAQFIGNSVLSGANPEPCRGVTMLDVVEVVIAENRIDDAGKCASMISVLASDIFFGPITFRDNVVWRHGAPADGGDVLVAGTGGPLQITGNTVVGAGLTLAGGRGRGLLHGNVVSEAPFHAAFVSTASCNVSWPESLRIIGPGHVESSDNITHDPWFCDAAGGDFHVAANSPCVNNTACGRIGVFGTACASTAILEMSWGAIKARYGQLR